MITYDILRFCDLGSLSFLTRSSCGMLDDNANVSLYSRSKTKTVCPSNKRHELSCVLCSPCQCWTSYRTASRTFGSLSFAKEFGQWKTNIAQADSIVAAGARAMRMLTSVHYYARFKSAQCTNHVIVIQNV